MYCVPGCAVVYSCVHVMSGEVAGCRVGCGNLVGVSVFRIMCFELADLYCRQCDECAFTSPVSIESGMLVTCSMQYAMSVSTVL